MKKNNTTDRRDFLKAAGATMLAASVPFAIAAQDDKLPEDLSVLRGEEIYLTGIGWNRDLPGIFGQVCLKLEMRAELGVGGFGTISDVVYSEINSQFQIQSAEKRNNTYFFHGRILTSRDLEMIGEPVIIQKEDLGDDISDTLLTIGNDTAKKLFRVPDITLKRGQF